MQKNNFFSLFVHYCDNGVRRGWHEAGAGGLSMLIFPEVILGIEAGLDFTAPFQPLEIPVPSLSKEFFLISGRDQFLDDVLLRPDEICGIIQISPDGTGYRKVLGFKAKKEPSPDLQVHLLVHEQYLKRAPNRRSVVYHSHPANMTTLSYLLPLEDEALTQTLSRSSYLFRDRLPAGVGVIWAPESDGRELATLTAEKFARCDAVLWAFRGLICVTESLPRAIGLVELLEKAAATRIRLLQIPGAPLQEPTD